MSWAAIISPEKHFWHRCIVAANMSRIINKQGKSEGFDSCDWPSNLIQIGFNRRFFSPCDPEIWWMNSKNYRAPLLHQTLCIISKPSVYSNWSYSPETFNLGQNWRFFVPCDLEIWWMTFKNNRAPLLCCFKLCASFHSHQWIQTTVTVRKQAINLGKNRQFLVLCDLEIWRMTLKNNRAPFLWCFKFFASFHSHQWIQTKVTVWKRPICIKICNFVSRVTLIFDGWPWKTLGRLF